MNIINYISKFVMLPIGHGTYKANFANCLLKSRSKYINLGVKKIPVVPVSYREKIRVGRSEIIIFFEYFFHGFFNN